MEIEFRILGPVQAWAGDTRIVLSGPRQQRALAALLLDPDRTVPIDHFVDVIWDQNPPPTAQRQVQDIVTRLRRSLTGAGAPPDIITTMSRGYTIHTAGHRVDAHVFRSLVTTAEELADVDAAKAAETLRTALALWSGPALAGLDTTALRSAAATWDERRISAWEQCLRLELELGRHREVVWELIALVDRQPFAEGPIGLLANALVRSGRRIDALDAYQRFRHRLVDELGVEPSAQLQNLHQAILLGPSGPAPRRATHAASAPVYTPAMLPPNIPAFAGRRHELQQLDQILVTAGKPSTVAISGMAGVGKTTLAVHWAHRIRSRFPDGQLFVNLRGFGPTGSVMASAAAIRIFLDALNVPQERIPTDLDARVGLYRSLTADKRLLILLDNARDADQVRPLLPGSDGCVVIVTSRSRLTGLVITDGAHPVAADLLTQEEARELLSCRLGQDRVMAEPEAVDEIITRCARLPLALAILASRAAAEPDATLTALGRQLIAARAALTVLGGEDAATDLSAVFSWSYHAVSEPAARLFRLLGLHPGPDFCAHAAASLVGQPVAETVPALGELAAAHLLVKRGPGRYAFHDLLRAYAAERVHGDEPARNRYAAQCRLFDHYLHSALAAAHVMEPARDSITPPPPRPGVRIMDFDGGRQEALAWLGKEHLVLMAVIDRATQNGFDRHAWQLTVALSGFLDNQGHWQDWVTSGQLAVDAAKRLGDRAGQARAERLLARAHAQLGSPGPARIHYRRALELYAELGDVDGQAATHFSVSWLAELENQLAESLSHAQHALDLYLATGHRVGQARALNAVGWSHALLGNYQETLDRCHRALALQADLGDHDGQAATWDSIGYAHHHLGNFRDAIGCYQNALDLYRRSGDRYNEADVLNHMATSYDALGEIDAAREARRNAAEILDSLNLPSP